MEASTIHRHGDKRVSTESRTVKPSKGRKSIHGALIPDIEQHGDNPVVIRLIDEELHTGVATKNVSRVPPLTPEWLSRDFYGNVHLTRVVENLLGPRPELRFINSKVACPGATGRQAVHSDVNHQFPEIPFGIVMSIYLQDSDASNGVTEI
ncbi:hypothetical protein LTR70_000533 [Exophiala xenobiotica]|nr:hypothetical protein LTR70_000533 [Exophiala xenobiotica]